MTPHTHACTHAHTHTHTLWVPLLSLSPQLKNMVSALFQCRPKSAGGTREFVKGGQHFGWKCIEDMYRRELVRVQKGQITRVPKLKESHVRRDSWTRLNVLPSKVMQVRFQCSYSIFVHHYNCSKMKY